MKFPDCEFAALSAERLMTLLKELPSGSYCIPRDCSITVMDSYGRIIGRIDFNGNGVCIQYES